MNVKDGGLAFSTTAVGHLEECRGAGHNNLSFNLTGGMSLRDYFAAQWLVGASQYWANTVPEKLAKEAYAMADAMLAEREK